MPSTRKIVTSAKLATKPVAPVAKPVPTAAAVANATAIVANAERKPSANITRTAATVAAQRTNFGTLSDRDTAYLAFYAAIAKRNALGNVTLQAIVADGNRPAYAGSNKPHDAGVIVRLVKAGHLSHTADGAGFTFTASGKTLAAYTSAKA